MSFLARFNHYGFEIVNSESAHLSLLLRFLLSSGKAIFWSGINRPRDF